MKRIIGITILVLVSTSRVYGITIGSTLDSCTVVSGSGIFTWTTPENGAARDGATASVSGLSSDTYSDYLLCKNTNGLGIPADGVIRGISFNIKRNCSGAGLCVDNWIRVVKNSVVGSTERATSTAWPTVLTDELHGSATDLWGNTWTPADVESANFGLALSVKGLTGGGGTGFVDGTQVFVDYDVPTPTNTATSTRTPTITPTSGTNSQTRQAGTCINLSGSFIQWITPANGGAVDGVTASASGLTNSANTTYLTCTNFGFSIPTDKVITGITASVRRNCSVASSCIDNIFFLVKTGGPSGSNRPSSTPWPGTLTDQVYGTANDLWSTTWTPDDINVVGFGAQLAAKGTTTTGATGFVDGFSITVTYDVPTPTPKIRCVTLTPTPSWTATLTPVGATYTATITSTPTRTATATSTSTRTNTATVTPISTLTATPASTATNTNTAPPAATFTITATPVSTSTATITAPPVNTSTSTRTPTIPNTPTAVSTSTATRTSLVPATKTATGTRTATPTKGSPTIGPTAIKTYAAYKLSLPDATTNPPNKAWADELVRRLRLNEFCGYTACKNINSSIKNTASSGVQTSGHLEFVNNKPTVTSCGTGASVVGSDSGGTITTGSTSTTACTLVFNKPWNNSPTCVVNMTAAADPRMFGATTTTVTIVYNASTSAIIRYVCIGS